VKRWLVSRAPNPQSAVKSSIHCRSLRVACCEISCAIHSRGYDTRSSKSTGSTIIDVHGLCNTLESPLTEAAPLTGNGRWLVRGGFADTLRPAAPTGSMASVRRFRETILFTRWRCRSEQTTISQFFSSSKYNTENHSLSLRRLMLQQHIKSCFRPYSM
jgi:hypothetical protein